MWSWGKTFRTFLQIHGVLFHDGKFSLCLKEHVVMGKNLSHFFTDTWSVISCTIIKCDEYLFCLLLCSGKQLFYMLLFYFHHSIGRTKP
jgi:hypothetical protein